MPGGTASSTRALSSIAPRRVVTRTTVAGLDAEPLQVVRRQAGDRLGLDRVEHRGAPGHGAGVPVLEQPAGGQDHRVLGVGQLVRAA